MSTVDHAAREVKCKIVYAGPGLVGKCTNVRHVHDRSRPEDHGKLIVLATETSRLMTFDLRARTLGTIDGLALRFFLYNYPTPGNFSGSRKTILKNVDGIVFVADSRVPRLDANRESLALLERELAAADRRLADVPLVMQYNKRDLPDILPVAALDAALNPTGRARVEAVASTGVGVFDTLKAVARQVVDQLRRQPGI